jgi:hypothetical protein
LKPNGPSPPWNATAIATGLRPSNDASETFVPVARGTPSRRSSRGSVKPKAQSPVASLGVERSR